MLYAQKFGDNITSVVIIMKWTDEEVMLKDLKTEMLFVIEWENFHGNYEEMTYECDISNYKGPDIARLLREI
jgi:hypothetical protein